MSEQNWKAGTGQTIQRLYAWIATEEDGGEGVVAVGLEGVCMTPLIGADVARISSMRAAAQRVSRVSGRPVRLKVFETSRTLEILTPEPVAVPR